MRASLGTIVNWSAGVALAVFLMAAGAGAVPNSPKKCCTDQQIVVSTSPPISGGNNYVTHVVSCPAGKVVSGGGVEFTDSSGLVKDGFVYASAPDATFTQWVGRGAPNATSPGGMGPGDRIRVYAICVSP